MPLAGASTRTLVFVAVLLVALAAAAGAIFLQLSDEDASILPLPSQESVYIEGVAGEAQRINPLFATENQVDADLSRLIFSGLVKLGTDGTVQADLADIPVISEGGRTYTFTLRDGLVWHDGVLVDSADVLFTIGLILDEAFTGPPELVRAWSDVQVLAPDSRTITIRTEQPSAPFLARFATLGILPEHLLRDVPVAKLADAPFNAAPIGTGPYMLESLSLSEARLVANDAYHLGRPAIDVIVLRFFPDYPTAQRELRAGTIDGLLIRDEPTVEQLNDLSDVDGLNVRMVQRAAHVLLYLNNEQTALFADERVRRAISLAIDRRQVVAETLRGVAIPSSSVIPPGTWAYAAEYDVLETNLEEARELLLLAGWQPHPTTGILVSRGAEFRFTIRTDSDPTRVAIAANIKEQLEPLGIVVNIASTTFAVLRRDFLQERNYQAAIAGWDQGPEPDPYPAWHSSQATELGGNIANYADVVSDRLIQAGRTSLDISVRLDSYKQFQDIWGEEVPSVILAYPQYAFVYASTLTTPAFGVLFTPADRFSEIHRWTN